MIRYYICDPDIAKQCCKGLRVKQVRYIRHSRQWASSSAEVFVGWTISPDSWCSNRVLFENLSEVDQSALTLMDTTFRQVDYFMLSAALRVDLNNPETWITL